MTHVTNSDTEESNADEFVESDIVLSTLLANLPVGALVEDTDRDILAVNPALCEILGMDVAASALVGRNCARLAGAQEELFADSDRFTSRTETILDRRESVYGEELRLADGRTLERTYVPYTLPDGEANLWLYRDVTDRTERERQLERQNERLEEFISVVSHDLRNPLNVATANLEVAAEASEHETLDTVSSALDRMNLLIEDLLLLARGGETIGEREFVDLAKLIRECWSAVETGEATLEIDSDRFVRADRSRLAQVFENLFRNSVEHSSTSSQRGNRAENSVEHSSTGSRPVADDSVEHGSTSPDSQARRDSVEHASTVSQGRNDSDDAIEHADGAVRVTVGTVADGFYVEDDGPGIPDDERQRIFERGYSTAGQGTGLGLRIVERIVEAHNWEITLADTERSGARFEITGVEFID